MNATLKKNRSGIAMILVVIVMAAAAVMGFALLSSASMQADASRYASYSFIAEDLDRSGTNLASYYLLNPDKVDASLMSTSGNTTFFNPGANVSSLSLSNGAAVSNVVVSLTSRSGQLVTYTVDVTANSGTASNAVSRTQHSTVQVAQRYLPKYAFAANDSFTIPLTFLTSSITGATRADNGMGGLLTVVNGVLFGTQTNPTPSYPTVACPAYAKINIAKTCSANQTYSLNNATYSCASLGSSTLTNANFVPGSNNPGNVYYLNNSTTLSGTINLSGTLVMDKSANLTIAGTTNITPKTGYPALVVGKDIVFSGAGRTLKVNGLAWVGGNITGTGALPSGTLNVNGALMMAGTGPKIDTSKLLGATSRLVVAYPTTAPTIDTAVPDLLYVPEFSDMDQTPKSIKIADTTVATNSAQTPISNKGKDDSNDD